MSLLTVIQQACGLLSLAQPSAVVTSNDLQVQQLLTLAQEEGQELRKGGDLAHDWTALTEEQVFTTLAQPAQTGILPTDFDHFIPDSFYNRMTRRKVIGPITVQEWQAIQAQPALSRVYLAFRQRGSQFLITPTPPSGQIIAFEYQSVNWCQSAGGASQSMWKADTDTALLDEWLMVLGIRWRFKKSKSLDYAEDFTTYQRQVEIAIARDKQARKLDLAGGHRYGIRANLPEGDFPEPVG